MIEHAFYAAAGEGDRKHKSLIAVRLCSGDNEFRAEVAKFSDQVPASELRGVSFQVECTTTDSKQSIVYLNLNGIDIETVGHEVRHALMWVRSDRFGKFSLNLLEGDAEEQFARLLDDTVCHVVGFIQQRFGELIPYIHGANVDRFYQEEMPQEIKDLMEE